MNKEIFLFINSFAGKNHILDLIMISAAKSIPYIFILALFYLWFSKRKNETLFAGYASILGIIINDIIRHIYFHPRPFMEHLGTMLIQHKASSSFPSNHTTFTMSIALMLLTFKSTRILGIVLTILALWCGIARIYVGVHWPFDILGSITVSIIAVIIIVLLKNPLQKLNNFIINIWNKILRIENKTN